MHRFQDIAFGMSNVAIVGYTSCVLAPSEGFPRDDLRKVMHRGQRMAGVQNGIETLLKTSISSVGARTLQTDRRQTDRRAVAEGATNKISITDVTVKTSLCDNWWTYCFRNVDPPIWYDTDVKLFEIQRV